MIERLLDACADSFSALHHGEGEGAQAQGRSERGSTSVSESDEKAESIWAEREYNPEQVERDDWRRVARTYVGKLRLGKVEIHFDVTGEPRTVRTFRRVETAK